MWTVKTIGRSVDGLAIKATTLGKGAQTLLVIAAIHGSEPAGTPLVEALIDHLTRSRSLLAGRRVVLVARANPDGLAAAKRYNRRGVDLNRNFPSRNRHDLPHGGEAGLSEPETQTLADLIRRIEPDRIVSIHQPLACVDYDGPGQALAREMASACGLPLKKLGAKSGSLGAYAGVDLNIPTITLELPGPADSKDPTTLWDLYGPAMLVAIRGPERDQTH